MMSQRLAPNRLVAGCISLLLLAVLPTSSAQSEPASIDDPQGDWSFDPPETPREPFEQDGRQVDLASLEVGPDTATTIPFTITFHEGAEISEEQSVLPARYNRIQFKLHDAHYAIQTSPFAPCNAYALVLILEATSDQRIIECLDPEIDGQSNSIRFELAKNHLSSVDGTPLAAGDTLEDIQATAWKVLASVPGPDGPTAEVRVMDTAPDDHGISYTIKQGGESSHPNRFTASTRTPLRATNGAETTFRYDVSLSNHDSTPLQVRPTVTGLWNGAQAFANQSVTVPPESTITEHVYLQIPFGHQHGETNWVTIQYTDDSGVLWSEIQLGVHWLAIPQPAGHHPRIWLHSSADQGGNDPEDTLQGAGTEASGWMNAVEEDPSPAARDGPLAIISTNGGVSPNNEGGYQAMYAWVLPLEPQLGLGLNFTPDASHVLTSSIDQLTPGSSVRVQSSLAICSPTEDALNDPNPATGDYGCRGETTVITSGSSGPMSTGPSGDLGFEVEMTVPAEHRLIPFAPENNLILRIELTESPSTSDEARLIVRGSTLDLALGEYTEPSPLSGDPLNAKTKDQSIESIPDATPEEHESPASGWLLSGILVLGVLARIRSRTP